MATVPESGLAAIQGAYRAAAAGIDDAALAAERSYSREWMRSFDPDTLAASRESIQARGRSQVSSAQRQREQRSTSQRSTSMRS